MLIYKIVVGTFQANCYLIADPPSLKFRRASKKTKECIIIDPGDESEKISSAIEKNNLKPEFILLTHSHPDHIGAVEAIKNIWSCDVLKLKMNEKIKIGEIEIKVIATPGHTPESVCFISGCNIFSGDTLFKGGIGRTDLPTGKAGLKGGDFNQIQKSLKCLMEFPDNFKVWPGHGEETLIGEERKSNLFLRF